MCMNQTVSEEDGTDLGVFRSSGGRGRAVLGAP